MKKLELFVGGANFGSPYGVSSNSALDPYQLDSILKWSQNHIDGLDLALDYKDSHKKVAGKIGNLKVATKISFDNLNSIDDLRKSIATSLTEIGRDYLDIVYVRFPLVNTTTLKAQQLWQELKAMQAEKFLHNLGISVYEPQDIEFCLEVFPGIEYIQVPENIASRAFSDYFERNSFPDTFPKIFVRSIFLQGLLVMKEEEIPRELGAIKDFRAKLREYASSIGISVLQLCVQYVRQLKWASGSIVGVNSVKELHECVAIFKSGNELNFDFLSEIPDLPIEILDPRYWKKA